MLNEYNNQYTRQLDQAKILAEYGNFSGYADIYGAEAAQNMTNMWYTQNPDLAYTMGLITKDQKDNIKGGRPINDGLDENGVRIAAVGGGGGYGGDSWYGAMTAEADRLGLNPAEATLFFAGVSPK